MAPATTDEALKNENDATLRRKNALNLERLTTAIRLDACTSCNGASVELIEQAVLRPRRVQSRRRVAQMRKVRSKDRPWTYPQYEFHGGALPGSGADRPRLPELKSRIGFRSLTTRTVLVP